MVVTGPDPNEPSEKANARYEERVSEQGPGMHVTSGAVGMFTFENV